MLCSANGILFGMDTGVIGPVTDMKDFKASFGGSQNATIHGLIVSSILIPAALSSFFAGHLADKLGRPKGISIGIFIFGIGAAIEAAAVSLGMFIAGRVIEGLGEGLFLGDGIKAWAMVFINPSIGTLVVYIAEISPTSTRGMLTTGPQLLITAGIMTGYFICYGSSGIKSSLSWRTPFILLASLSMVLCTTTFFFLPPSPRWLTLHGRRQEAEQAWDKLGVSHAEREKVELEAQGVGIAAPTDKSHTMETVGDITVTPKPNVIDKLLDIFSKDVRSRTALVVFMMGMQQLSGIDGVLYVRSHLLIFFQSLLTLHLVRPAAFPAGRACLVRSELLCLWYLSTRDFLRDYSWTALRRQMGPSRQCHLRRCWIRRRHVPDWRSVRWKCRPWNLRSWSLGGNCCHLYLCRHLLDDLGSQHQDLRA